MVKEIVNGQVTGQDDVKSRHRIGRITHIDHVDTAVAVGF